MNTLRKISRRAGKGDSARVQPSRKGLEPHEDEQHAFNSSVYWTGLACVEDGCSIPAGTRWGEWWCRRHNAERIKRIRAGLVEIGLGSQEGWRIVIPHDNLRKLNLLDPTLPEKVERIRIQIRVRIDESDLKKAPPLVGNGVPKLARIMMDDVERKILGRVRFDVPVARVRI